MSRRQTPLQRFLSSIALIIVLAVVIAAGVTGYWYLGPYKGFSAETFVEIDHGMSSRAIAQELANHGVVRSWLSFMFVRVVHPATTLQAGEYRFGSQQTPWQVFDKIRRGEVFYEDFTVPEGSNIFDIANLLRNSDTVRADDFLKAAADPSGVRDLDPLAPSLEGYLFPSTYRVTHKTTANQLCHAMIAEFRKQWQTASGATEGSDLHNIVTLASLVEKESAVPAERPLIAGVFRNRLRQDIPLQCDPTTIYAALLQSRYRGTIHKSDLASASPYNTYTHPGLPPGPICNPSLASLKAALQPATTDYLYFVAKADGSGAHHFSATLDEHQRAVAEYRKAHRP